MFLLSYSFFSGTYHSHSFPSLSLSYFLDCYYVFHFIHHGRSLPPSIDKLFLYTHTQSKQAPVDIARLREYQRYDVQRLNKRRRTEKKRKWTKEYINYDTYSMGEDNNKKYGIEAQYPPLLSSNQHTHKKNE